jgi:hypothetical protein
MVWRKAEELYDIVDMVAESFPPRIQFSVADQFRPAVLLVLSAFSMVHFSRLSL